MEYIEIGKIVNTHGIKGEVRIISSFLYKEKIFKINKVLYLGESKEKIIINSYRKHKNFDMITFNNITDIKDVIKYKNMSVYVKREDIDLKENEYLLEDLIDMECIYKEKNIGFVKEIQEYGLNKLIKVNDKLIPINSNFIKNVNLKEKRIVLDNVEGLI